MELPLKYGSTTQRLRLAPDVRAAVLAPPRTAAGESDPVGAALREPIGSPRLSRLVRPGQRVVIVTADITRPCPSAWLLPPILDELHEAGIADGNITVVFGLGTHRPHTRAEQEGLVGPAVFRRVRCIDSDPADVERVGVTNRGTPVDVFRPVRRADARILLGVIEYHYFAGYSGGVKALVPGVCTEATIVVDPGRVGAFAGLCSLRRHTDGTGRGAPRRRAGSVRRGDAGGRIRPACGGRLSRHHPWSAEPPRGDWPRSFFLHLSRRVC